MSNLKSAREIKLRNFVKDKLSLYSAKVSNLNSRNQSNAKCTKTNKIIKQNIITNMNTNQKEKEKNYINCNTKNLSRGKSKKNKKNFPLLLLQRLISYKYDFISNHYFKQFFRCVCVHYTFHHFIPLFLHHYPCLN